MDVRSIVESYLAALSTGDVDTAVSIVADDFVNEHASELGSGLVGRQAYAERLPTFLEQFEGLHYEIVELIVDGPRAAAQYRMTATFDGHPIDIPGVMLFHVTDGMIARRTDVWDGLTFLRQTGAGDER